jgi:hypothetical protein
MKQHTRLPLVVCRQRKTNFRFRNCVTGFSCNTALWLMTLYCYQHHRVRLCVWCHRVTPSADCRESSWALDTITDDTDIMALLNITESMEITDIHRYMFSHHAELHTPPKTMAIFHDISNENRQKYNTASLIGFPLGYCCREYHKNMSLPPPMKGGKLFIKS